MDNATLQVILDWTCTMIIGCAGIMTAYLWITAWKEKIKGASLYFGTVLLTCMLAIAGLWMR